MLLKKMMVPTMDTLRNRPEREELEAEWENLPDPGILAREIVEDLEAALELFRDIAEDLNQQEIDV